MLFMLTKLFIYTLFNRVRVNPNVHPYAALIIASNMFINGQLI